MANDTDEPAALPAAVRAQPRPDGAHGGLWWGSFAGFVVLLTVNALGYYALPLYIGVIGNETDISGSVTTIASSVFFLAGGVGGLFVAPLLQRWSSQSIICVGGLVTAAGAALVGWSTNAATLSIAFILLSFSNFAAGPLSVSTVLIRRREAGPTRNQAIAVALTGMTAAGVVVAPTLTVLVDHVGLRTATALAAIGAAFIIVPSAIAGLRSWPTPAQHSTSVQTTSVNSATETDGRPDTTPAPANVGSAGARHFAVVCILFSAFSCAQIGLVTQIYALAVDRGVSNVGLALGLVSSMGLGARLVGVVLVRILRPSSFITGMAVCQTAAALVLGTVHSPAGLFLGVALLGCAVGNASVLMPLVTLELFGTDRYPQRLARLQFITSLFGALGPALFGALRGLTGGFAAGLGEVAVLSGLSVTLGLRLLRLPAASGRGSLEARPQQADEVVP